MTALAAPILDAIPPRTAMIRLKARWELARRHPLAFQRWFVYTNRASKTVDAGGRVYYENVETPFPWRRSHLQWLNEVWLHNQVGLVSKCRQMLVTWWLATLGLWDALMHDGRLLMFQSKREEDVLGDMETGDGLMGRAKYILTRIPYQSELGIEYAPFENGTAKLVISSRHSTIWAIPQGGSVIRQRTAGGIATDETAQQLDFEESFTAAMACIRSGGWYWGATTAALKDKGFSRKLVKDLGDDEQ